MIQTRNGMKLPNNGIARNPMNLASLFFHRRPYYAYIRDQKRRVRITMQEPGVVRRFWRMIPRYTGAGREFSWTKNQFDPGTARNLAGGVSTKLNYVITGGNSALVHGGNQLSRPMIRPTLTPSAAQPIPRLIHSGNVQARPVLRVRIPSYGSRIPALNSSGPGVDVNNG